MNRYGNDFITNKDNYSYFDLKKVFEKYPVLKKLPRSLKVLLESNIRNIKEENFSSLIRAFENRDTFKQINFYVNRVILKDDYGVAIFSDLASIRDSLKEENKDLNLVNPKIIVDLIIDDVSIKNKIEKEDKYHFLKWAGSQFDNFSVIPPSQNNYNEINLEYLATILSSKQVSDKVYVFPEAIIGTDSHTTMINALGILALKANSLEIQSSILGSALTLLFPKVLGIELKGALSQGLSSNDIVLALVDMIKDYEIKGKIVEFYGSALKNISIEDRATISNEISKYEALCGYFAMDSNTISYLERTRGVNASFIEEYFINQDLTQDDNIVYDEELCLDLSLLTPTLMKSQDAENKISVKELTSKLMTFKKGNFVNDNDIVLAQISSDVISSNPIVLVQAGLLAKRACLLGLNISKNINCTLYLKTAIFKEYLESLDLLQYLEKLGFELVEEYNDKLIEIVSLDIDKFNLNVVSLHSSSDDYQETNNLQIKSKILISPSLLIAYCLKGNINFDITKEALYQDIYLSDVWPSVNEVNEHISKIDSILYQNNYKDIFLGNKTWIDTKIEEISTYTWNENSTYIQKSNFFESKKIDEIDIKDARILALLEDNISTKDIAANGQILTYSPAALYLESKGLRPDEFNTYESRTSNAEVMLRGVLSSTYIKNKIVHPKTGAYTKDFVSGEIMSFYDFSQKMQEKEESLVIFAGKNYGEGKAQDWASKGIKLLGVKAIIAESFDEKHKLNLISRGILPLEFIDEDMNNLNLKGDELITIKTNDIKQNMKIELTIKNDEKIKTILLQSKIASNEELLYYKNSGILAYTLNKE